MTPTDREVAGITIGTAGHIDHGKSSLVNIITGTDPDRLPEEKKRGLTIDLGYATVSAGGDRSIGVIDVPGHEKFIKNMVAGATGMDLVVLVVAADDGVMPQTREHLEIMDLLGISRGMIALNKIDLVDEEMRELALEDVKDFVKGTFLEGAPIMPVSSVTGEGAEEFRAALDRVIGETPPHPEEGPFRMPVQRVFSAKGHGTVVTGVPASGRIRVGDSVEVLPARRKARIRRVQAYMTDVDVGKAGHRTALNLSDVSYKDLVRGDVVAEPEVFTPTRYVEGRMRYLHSAKKPLLNGTVIRFHTGCMESLGKCYLIDRDYLEPGDEALIQVKLENETVVAPGDRFIVRTESPMVTVGGGVIFDRSRFRIKRLKDFAIDAMLEKEKALSDKKTFLEIVMRERGIHPLPRKDLPLEILLPRAGAERLAAELEEEGALIPIAGGTTLIHNQAVELAAGRIKKALEEYFEENNMREFADRGALVKSTPLDENLLDYALSHMVEKGDLEESRGGYNLKGRKIKMSSEVRAVMDRAEKLFLDAALSTPTIEEAAEKLGAPLDRVQWLVGLLKDRGVLKELKNDVLFHEKALEEAADKVRRFIEKNEKMSAGDFRTLASTTRKYAIPVLEHFDRIGLTRRVGDDRVLA